MDIETDDLTDGLIDGELLEYWRKVALPFSNVEFTERFSGGFLVLKQQPSKKSGNVWIKTGSHEANATLDDETQTLTDLSTVDEKAVCLKKMGRNSYAAGITIGRARNNDVVIRSGRVSKLQAVLSRREEEHYSLADMGSTNGTFVNDVKLAPKEPVDIKSGDSIAFWYFKFVYLKAGEFFDYLCRL